MDDIYEYGLTTGIVASDRNYELSHYILFVRTVMPNEKRFLYVPAERFKSEE